MCARVAQWWSIALPRRGSRVRIPSRALKEIEKESSDGWLFFLCSSPAGLERFECLRSAPVVAVERPPDVLRCLVLSKRYKERHPMDGSFFYVRVLPGSNGSNVYVPLRSSQQFQMLVKRRIAWYDKICSEMLAECISRNCRQHTIEFMHESHTLKKV